MTQRPLFAKAARFTRPRRTVSKYGDKRREWHLTDGSGKVVETRGVDGIQLARQFKAIIFNAMGECLISRHRKLRPAQVAVIKATDQAPKPTKARKVKR